MFEKDAEEWVKDYIIKSRDCILQPCKTLEDCQDKELEFDEVVKLVKDGAEFGYNKANEEHEGKCRTAYIKGLRTMAKALKDYDRTNGAWTDYFEHTVDKVLKNLLEE